MPSVFVENATLKHSDADDGVPPSGCLASSEKKVSSPPPMAARRDARIVDVLMATSMLKDASPSTATGASSSSVVDLFV